VHGAYLQDWLQLPTDWNWRLEPERGGALRAVGDIGSHWLDLVQFVTGLEVEAVFADLATAIPVRHRPIGEVETFAAADDVDRIDEPMATDDLAHILLRFRGGARGSCVVSQISAGRKNAIRFEVDGSRGSLAWDGEAHEQLWLGRRDAPNELLLRNPGLMNASARATTVLPAGHAEGFADTFRELYRAVYRAVAAGEPGYDYPTFRAGHVGNVLGEAIAESNRDGRWVEVSL
jgi:predicted dehydrogenase